MNIFRQMTLGRKYPALHLKCMDQEVEIENLNIINRKLLARSERFHTACVSLERQKTALALELETLRKA